MSPPSAVPEPRPSMDPTPTPPPNGGVGLARHGAGVRFVVAAAVLVGGVGLALLYTQRPQGQFYFPRCSFHAVTGLHCPGCGGLRATHEFLHGHWLAALRSNALMLIGLPALVVWQGLEWWLGRSTMGPKTVWAIFGVIVLFTLLRNLPWQPFLWLAPS